MLVGTTISLPARGRSVAEIEDASSNVPGEGLLNGATSTMALARSSECCNASSNSGYPFLHGANYRIRPISQREHRLFGGSTPTRLPTRTSATSWCWYNSAQPGRVLQGWAAPMFCGYGTTCMHHVHSQLDQATGICPQWL